MVWGLDYRAPYTLHPRPQTLEGDLEGRGVGEPDKVFVELDGDARERRPALVPKLRLAFGVQGLGFRLSVRGCGVSDLGFRA